MQEPPSGSQFEARCRTREQDLGVLGAFWSEETILAHE